jgi:hypothetical protein
MKPLRASIFICFAGLVWLLAAMGTRADEVLEISGTVATVGNSASNCNPNPCAIVVDFSSEVLITDSPSDGPISIQGVPNTWHYKVQSSLGNSSGSGTLPSTLFYSDSTEGFGYIIMPGFPGELDLDFEVLRTGSGLDFQSEGTDFYTCFTTTCIQDFVLPKYQNSGGCDGCVTGMLTYPVEVLGFSATQVPEPSSLEFSLCAVVILGLAVFRAGGSRCGLGGIGLTVAKIQAERTIPLG